MYLRLVAIIPIQIHAEGRISIVSPIFTPITTARWVRRFVVNITIGIDTGDEIQGSIVHDVLDFGISRVVFEEIPHIKNELTEAIRLAGVVEGVVKNFGFGGFIRIRIIRNS